MSRNTIVCAVVLLCLLVSHSSVKAQDLMCEQADLEGHGAGCGTGCPVSPSDSNPLSSANATAEYFQMQDGDELTVVRWWGVYTDASLAVDCVVDDDFTLIFYANTGSDFSSTPVVVTPLATHSPGAVVNRAATGRFMDYVGLGDRAEYVYEVTLDTPFSPGAGSYWVAIINNTPTGSCVWLWSAAPGDGFARMDHGGGFADHLMDYDCALCLNPAPVVVPAVSSWGLVAMALITLVAGTVALERRRTTSAVSNN